MLLRLLLLLLYSEFGDKNLLILIINQLGLNWKIRHGAIVDNVVTYVCAKYGAIGYEMKKP